jgi:cytochrome o ubiquinol oxidase subunit 2
MKKYKFAIFSFLSLLGIFFIFYYLHGKEIAVLHPAGEIGLKQRDLIYLSTFLMLIVVIPVFAIAVFVAWKYRASNKKAKYTPDWDFHLLAETLWWGFPLVIIAALSVVVWKSSHELDPFKPIDSDIKPLTIQVVALQWKWLFIYPEQNIATINYVQFPEKTPLHFEITSDAPMNAFWIPRLGGQIYAMPGMKTELHLIANEIGTFRGSSANLSGEGFAGMVFSAKATTSNDFETWVQSVRKASPPLNYEQVATPSSYAPMTTYQLQNNDLFETILRK